MKRIALLGTVIALLLIGAALVAYLHYGPSLTQPGDAKVVGEQHDRVARSQEIPISTHRAISMAASVQTTSLLPWGIALDSTNGFVWVTEPGCQPKTQCQATQAGVLGQYAYSDGSLIQNLYEPEGFSSPLFVAIDKAGDVWFTEPDSDAIGEYNPQNQQWNQWHVTKGSEPFDLTIDSYGNLWFTEFSSNSLGFFDTRTHKVMEQATPTPGSNPYGITTDPQGRIWIAENGAGVNQIASFTPTPTGSTKITEYASGGLRAHFIATDQAGNIWYSGGFGGNIGEFNPQTGNATVFPIHHGTCTSPGSCAGTHISGITVDVKGNVWFTDSLSQQVGYLIPSTGQTVEKTLEVRNAHPYDGLMVDSSGRVWFIEEFDATLNILPASSFK